MGMSKGFKFTEESRKKMKLSQIGRKHSEETKNKIRASNIGKVFSDEHKRNISLAKTGHKFSLEVRKRLLGKGRGRVISEETKEKIRLTNIDTWNKKRVINKCMFCGDSMFVKNSGIRKFCSREHCILWYKNNHRIFPDRRGSKNSNWRGGVSSVAILIRRSLRYKKWVKNRMEIDNYTCNVCNEKGYNLEVHHKKPFSKLLKEAIQSYPLLSPVDAAMLYCPLWSIENGITVHKGKCHKKFHPRGYRNG